MYLKKLELSGFKSFAERTTIEFDQGITAIVGPNGSGKSNITEALRWVMGEQSAKSLRGGKMPDVIFSGTEMRRAMNAAEVIAYFDNTEGDLNGERDVAVTRRLYKNGDSDYLINGKKKRLKDIHDLFLDTGTGRDSLSIISQGRIEAIFSAKPEERRAIFEEAAGVLKYKTRKKETEARLSATQENLDRLEDIIFELQGQLTPLRAQREVALSFRTLDEKRQALNLSVLVARLDKDKARYDEGQVALQTTLSALTELLGKQKSVDSELTELNGKRQEAEKQLEALQTQILSLTELKANLERQIGIFEEQQKSVAKSSAEKQERLTALAERKKALETQLSEADRRRIVLKNNSDQLQHETLELEKEIAAFSEDPQIMLEKLRDDYLTVVTQEAQLSNTLTKNQADKTNIEARAEELSENVRENTEKLTAAQAELQIAQEKQAGLETALNGLLTTFKEAEQERRELTEQLAAAQQAQFTGLDKLKTLKAKRSSLIAIRESHSNLYQGVRAVLEQARDFSGMIGVVSDLITFEAQYATALDVALAASAQNIITEDEGSAQSAIQYLRKNRLGRATFLPLTTIKPRDFREWAKVSTMTGFVDMAVNLVHFDERLRSAISYLLGATVIVDTSEHATAIARALHFNVRIVTLEGMQINPGGSYAGGSRKQANTTFTSNEIDQLTKEIDSAEAQQLKEEAVVKKMQDARTQLSAKLEQLRIQGEEKRENEQVQQLKIAQLTQTTTDLKELLALSITRTDTEQLSDLDSQNVAIKEKLRELADRKLALEIEQDTLKNDSAQLVERRNTKIEALTTLKVKTQEIISDLQHVNSEKLRLTHDLSALTEEENVVSAITNEIQEPLSKEVLNQRLNKTAKTLEATQIKQVSMRMEREDLAEQIKTLEEKNTENQRTRESLNNQKTRLELETEQLSDQLRRHQTALSEDYQLSYERAQSQSETLTDLEAAEKSLRSFERQIRALGPVNSDAVRQFDEVNARFELYTTQKMDLDEAKNLLLSNISEMDDEVKERFKSTFDAIRISFQTTFTQMFRGGKADLELTTADLLAAGIEINVQPPGKKLASLHLMSGGEKALTALALLFAILRVRPVPFVVLDEVEAALDEANVKRFGDYMNHFDSSHQFIVVTHRKGTMAAANVLYGVTMADAGVSKVVSVRFEEENKAQSVEAQAALAAVK